MPHPSESTTRPWSTDEIREIANFLHGFSQRDPGEDIATKWRNQNYFQCATRLDLIAHQEVAPRITGGGD